jgi:hypothetical protein
MAFTYTDRNNKVILHSWGRFKAVLGATVVEGDLLNNYASSASTAMILADEAGALGAVAVACESGVSGDEITCALAAEVKAPTTLGAGGAATQTYFAESTDYIGSAVYLDDDGKVSDTIGSTTPQYVGLLTARDKMLLCPGGSISGGAGSFTTLAATGACALSSTLAVTSTSTLTGAVATASTFTAGTSGSPAGDFTLWATLANAKVWFDVNGDTNGAFYFGADDYGLYCAWYGDTTLYGVHWDPSGDTNGAWYFGADDYGVDVAFYGQTASNSMIWDASANALVFTAGGITMGSTSALILPVKTTGTTQGEIWLDTNDYKIHYYTTETGEYTITSA